MIVSIYYWTSMITTLYWWRKVRGLLKMNLRNWMSKINILMIHIVWFWILGNVVLIRILLMHICLRARRVLWVMYVLNVLRILIWSNCLRLCCSSTWVKFQPITSFRKPIRLVHRGFWFVQNWLCGLRLLERIWPFGLCLFFDHKIGLVLGLLGKHHRFHNIFFSLLLWSFSSVWILPAILTSWPFWRDILTISTIFYRRHDFIIDIFIDWSDAELL